ncbi:nitroreductase [Cupriavidus basilensis OR16]|uniref:Putative NAD(P)H nitroreductase n=1 Tax=Cupriavidus basilensis OR16 TaxID=1127483 RepID=H1S875_9BURK|nr:nitroreductase [Cupriavidus basilensis]EHP41344.1 nitroreductase [Cupriavidus basilensis OR16]
MSADIDLADLAELALSDAQRTAFGFLLTRQSPWPLGAPAPSPKELDLVFEAALRAPDHGQLQPWRFIVIRDEARAALGEVFVRAAQARDPQSDGERFRVKAMAAPMLIALGVHVERGHKVPEIEQLLATAAATMNMLNALHILGYGGFWATGLNSYDESVRQALGLGEEETLLGFLYVGTPKEAVRPASRPAPEGFVREWRGPA